MLRELTGFTLRKKGDLIKFIAVTGGKADFYTLPKEKSDFLKMLFNTFLVSFNANTIIYSMLFCKIMLLINVDILFHACVNCSQTGTQSSELK